MRYFLTFLSEELNFLQYGPAKLTRNYITAPSENAVMQLCSFVSILLDHTVVTPEITYTLATNLCSKKSMLNLKFC